MKKLILFLLLLTTARLVQAQSYLGFDAKGVEWAQLAEQKLTNRIQNAMSLINKDILGNISNVKNTINDLKGLYDEYYSIYADISKNLKKYEKILDIKDVVKDLNSQGWTHMYDGFIMDLTDVERESYQSLLLQGCIKFSAKKLTELGFILTPEGMKMSEEERINRIDKIYDSLVKQSSRLQSVVIMYKQAAKVNKEKSLLKTTPYVQSNS